MDPQVLSLEDRRSLEALDARLKTILPEEYQESYEDVQPVPMGSAGLKYDRDGKVAWNEIWASFCDLAMAGGPPHKGTLLEAGRRDEVEAHPHRYGEVAEEICRGVMMAAFLDAAPAPDPGWIRVTCLSEGMAGWLLRAIVMENVAVRIDGVALDLPAAPHFRLEKEIKNVVTVIAKTSHYWLEHMPRSQQRAITSLFARLAGESPLVTPAPAHAESDAAGLAATIERETRLAASDHRYAGWLGVRCPSIRGAVWMMRALVAGNVLSRREGTTLFVPVNPAADPGGEAVVRALSRVHHLAGAKHVL
jgi:sirohydrochlorin cobaltochelatase